MDGEVGVPEGTIARDWYILKGGGVLQGMGADNLRELLGSKNTLLQRWYRDKLVSKILISGKREQREVLEEMLVDEVKIGGGDLFKQVEVMADGHVPEEKMWGVFELAKVVKKTGVKIQGRQVDDRIVSMVRALDPEMVMNKDDLEDVGWLVSGRGGDQSSGFDAVKLLAGIAQTATDEEKARMCLVMTESVYLIMLKTGRVDGARLEALRGEIIASMSREAKQEVEDSMTMLRGGGMGERLLQKVTSRSVGDLVVGLGQLVKTSKSEIERSAASLVAVVLEKYEEGRQGGKNRIIVDLDASFDRLAVPIRNLSFGLPEGMMAVNIETTQHDGPNDNRLWHTNVLIREGEMGGHIFAARTWGYVVGQNEKGVWEMVGRFGELLDEQPEERIVRLIRERWQGEDIKDDRAKAERAVDVFLTNAIAPDHGYGDSVRKAFRVLKNVNGSAGDAGKHPDEFLQLPEYLVVRAALAEYCLNGQDGMDVEGMVRRMVTKDGVLFFPYQLDYDPVVRVKEQKRFMRVLSISFTDVDRFLGKLQNGRVVDGG
jgi:hypothetical protein